MSALAEASLNGHTMKVTMNRQAAMEQLMEIKLKEFEVKFVEKMDDLDETFQSIVKRQSNTENLVAVQHKDSVKLIEDKSKELHYNIVTSMSVRGNWRVGTALLRLPSEKLQVV